MTGEDVRIHEIVTVALGKIQNSIAETVPNYISKIPEIGLNFFIIFFVMFYLFIDGARIADYIASFFPTRLDHSVFILQNIKKSTKAVLVGQLLTAIIQGLVGGIGLWIFGIPNFIFWTFIMIILSIIPLVGPAFIWLPAVFFLFLNGHSSAAIGLLVYGLLIVSTIDNFVRPKLISAGTNVHPIAVLLGVLGGISVFGLVGFLIGPVILSLFVILLESFKKL